MADKSFREIYDRHSKMVYNLCLFYLQNIPDAEEATQDVFMKVHEKKESFTGRSSLKTWIYRITVNQCLDMLKAKKRKKRFGFLVSLFGNEDETPVDIPDFEHPGIKVEDKEAVLLIMKQLYQLPEQQKTAVLLRAVEGLGQEEIASIMHISVKAVESLLSRARATLKIKLKPKE